MLMHIVKINLLKMSLSKVMKELKLLKLKLKVGKILLSNSEKMVHELTERKNKLNSN